MRKKTPKRKSPVNPVRRYSKSSAFYVETKQDFFSSNDLLVQKTDQLNDIYRQQPARKRCKLCNYRLRTINDFISHAVSYSFCDKCGHLNGAFDDTNEFVQRLYVADGGRDYSKNYIDNNFPERAR